MSNEFVTAVLAAAQVLYPDSDPQIEMINKSNDRLLTAITLNCNSNMRALVYLDGISSVDAAMDQISAAMENSMSIHFDTAKILSPEELLSHVEIAVLNRDQNQSFIEGKPTVDVNNELVGVYYLDLARSQYASERIYITDRLMDIIQVPETEIKRAAMENLRKELVITPLSSMVFGLASGQPTSQTEEVLKSLKEGTCPEPFVITNKVGDLGAAEILILDEIFKDSKDLYICPSSVHELICFPVDLMDPISAQEMVNQINETEVSREDFLSNTVFMYDAEHQKIKAIANEHGLIQEEEQQAQSKGVHRGR